MLIFAVIMFMMENEFDSDSDMDSDYEQVLENEMEYSAESSSSESEIEDELSSEEDNFAEARQWYDVTDNLDLPVPPRFPFTGGF